MEIKAWESTCELRWGTSEIQPPIWILEQQWRNRDSGATEWRPVPYEFKDQD